MARSPQITVLVIFLAFGLNAVKVAAKREIDELKESNKATLGSDSNLHVQRDKQEWRNTIDAAHWQAASKNAHWQAAPQKKVAAFTKDQEGKVLPLIEDQDARVQAVVTGEGSVGSEDDFHKHQGFEKDGNPLDADSVGELKDLRNQHDRNKPMARDQAPSGSLIGETAAAEMHLPEVTIAMMSNNNLAFRNQHDFRERLSANEVSSDANLGNNKSLAEHVVNIELSQDAITASMKTSKSEVHGPAPKKRKVPAESQEYQKVGHQNKNKITPSATMQEDAAQDNILEVEDNTDMSQESDRKLLVDPGCVIGESDRTCSRCHTMEDCEGVAPNLKNCHWHASAKACNR